MTPYLSIVIPVFNEQGNIAALAEEINSALSGLGKPYEVIWVNDGSADASLAEIKKAADRFPGMKYLSLTRNFGQTAALAAGIDKSSGEMIALLDADGQNDPSDIPAMLAKINEGYDLVSGWRKNRRDNAATRILPSAAANWIISAMTGVKLHDYGCTLKIYRSEFLKAFRLYGEMHRFLPAFAGAMGARMAEMTVNHRPRTKGVSKYGLGRTFKVILDLATVKFMGHYLANPIYLFGGIGIACGGTSVLLAGITLYNKYYNHIFVKDQPLFLVAIFLALIGMLMIVLGLLSEILVRVYYEINDRPPYRLRGDDFDRRNNEENN